MYPAVMENVANDFGKKWIVKQVKVEDTGLWRERLGCKVGGGWIGHSILLVIAIIRDGCVSSGGGDAACNGWHPVCLWLQAVRWQGSLWLARTSKKGSSVVDCRRQ